MMALRLSGTLDALRLAVEGRWRELDMSDHATRQAVNLLRQRGHIERPVIATDAGAQALADWDADEPARTKRRAARAERFANCERVAAQLIRPAPPMNCSKFPLAATQDQINELKRKAKEDRSFGFESIGQRKTMKS